MLLRAPLQLGRVAATKAARLCGVSQCSRPSLDTVRECDLSSNMRFGLSQSSGVPIEQFVGKDDH